MSTEPAAEDPDHDLLVEEKGMSFTDMFRSKVSKDKNRYQVSGGRLYRSDHRRWNATILLYNVAVVTSPPTL